MLYYSKKFQTYRDLSIVFKNNSSLNKHIVYPEFIVNDSLFNEIKSKQDYLIRKKRHFHPSVFQSFLNLKNYLDTVIFPEKDDYNQIIKTKWDKERKEALIKYNQMLIDSLYSNVKIN